MGELRRYFSYIGKYKGAYWGNFVLTLLLSAVMEVQYSYMNKLVFNAVEHTDSRLFVHAVILCVILVVLRCLSPYLRYFQIKIVRKIVFDIKMKLFQKLMRLNMDFYEKTHSANALKILNDDANSLKDSYFSHVYWVVGKVFNGMAAVVAMVIYSPSLAVVSIVFSVITVRVSLRIQQNMKKMEKNIQGSISRLTERLSDILSGFILLKMYRGASVVLENFREENETVLREEKRRTEKAGSLEMISFLLGILGNFGTMIAGAVFVSQGRMDYGTVMAVVSLQMSVSGMVQRFGSSLTIFSASLVKAGRVFDFLEDGVEETEEHMEEIKEIKGNHAGGETETPVIIQNLNFSYEEGRMVLKQFSMKADYGERILLTGESGCGKSTLLRLLMGFYGKSSGKIRIFGRDIESYSLAQLRNMITYVPQNCYLFEGTIRENILMGCYAKEGMEKEVERAAGLAYADEFIRKLPQGYETKLLSGGSNLSGGQRQRIAIARAFLKDAPILLLDEPSSALDAESERILCLAMDELMKDKIVFMVTHGTNFNGKFDRMISL
ncbi:MAG: ABC transporter ATP-binding protein [Lachnospiraceae bacterium]